MSDNSTTLSGEGVMSQLIELSQALEVKGPNGSTVAVLVSAEQFTRMEEEGRLLREQLAAEQKRSSELLQQNEQLQKTQRTALAERDAYWGLLGETMREQLVANEEQVEAELREAMKNGVDSQEVVRQIEAILWANPAEKRAVG